MSRTHQIMQRTSESSLSIAADILMDTDSDGEALTAQRQAVRRFVQTKVPHNVNFYLLTS